MLPDADASEPGLILDRHRRRTTPARPRRSRCARGRRPPRRAGPPARRPGSRPTGRARAAPPAVRAPSSLGLAVALGDLLRRRGGPDAARRDLVRDHPADRRVAARRIDSASANAAAARLRDLPEPRRRGHRGGRLRLHHRRADPLAAAPDARAPDRAAQHPRPRHRRRPGLDRLSRGARAAGARRAVVAVEVSDEGRFVSPTRAAGIPVFTGDARHREVLEELRLDTARALVAATSDDLVNLSTALNARAMRPDLRVVVRLFDPEFAMRVQHGFGIRFTRSVSHLAAPAFAAAAIGSRGGRHGAGRRSAGGAVRPASGPGAGSALEGRLAVSLDTPGRRAAARRRRSGIRGGALDIPGRRGPRCGRGDRRRGDARGPGRPAPARTVHGGMSPPARLRG